MKIRKIGDALPTPNHRMAIGIQAIGEIGRRIWNSGFSVTIRAAHPAHPQAERHGDQHRQRRSRRRRASATRRCAPTACRRATSSSVPVTTCHGVGKIALCVRDDRDHQIAISTAITSERRQRLLEHPSSCSVLASHSPRSASESSPTASPARLRPRSSSARSRARCRRTGSSTAVSNGSRKLWPGIMSVGPNICGTSSRLRSSSTSLRPSVRRMRRRQDLDLVAGHAPRLGALRNLEQLVARRHARSARSPPSASAATARAASGHAAIQRAAHAHSRSRILRSCTKSSAVWPYGIRRAACRRDRSGRWTRNGRCV